METIAKAAVTTRNTAKNVIFIMMTGAPSHTDTFDLKEGAWTPASFKPTDYNGVRFPQGLMPTIAAQMDSIALLRSVRAWAGVHGLMQAWVQIGRNPISALAKISPHIGSVVSMELNTGVGQTLPTFLALNGQPAAGSGYFPTEHAPLLLTGGSALPNTTHRDGAARLEPRYGLLQDIDAESRYFNDVGPGPGERAAWHIRARLLIEHSNGDRIFSFGLNE